MTLSLKSYMLKYVNSGIVFQEIPDEVTLSVNISNCPCRCPGCHSQYLWGDTGHPLTDDVIDSFVQEYGNDITCIALMGGDAEPESVNLIAQYIHAHYPSARFGVPGQLYLCQMKGHTPHLENLQQKTPIEKSIVSVHC